MGGGSKDANLEIAELLIHIISTQTTENILAVPRDTASVGYCGSVIGGVPALLCDHGFFDIMVPCNHEPSHGKMSVDDEFGGADQTWVDIDIFDANTMLLPLSKRKSYGSGGLIRSVTHP